MLIRHIKDFESAIAELETIVKRLEEGDLALEKSLALYERGVQLSRFCHARSRKRSGASKFSPNAAKSSRRRRRSAPTTATAIARGERRAARARRVARRAPRALSTRARALSAAAPPACPAAASPRRCATACSPAASGCGRCWRSPRPRRLPTSASSAPRRIALALPAACAIEMIHTYSLIHDDLPAMDNDTLRRGRPTLHVVYGDGMAILAGDGLQTEAFALIAREPRGPTPARRRAKAAARRRRRRAPPGAAGMVGGQAIDLAGGRPGAGRPVRSTPTRLREMHARKTGALIRASALSRRRSWRAQTTTA